MFDVSINCWAIFLSAVASMVLGFLWYGPIFGKPWMRMMGLDPNCVTPESKKGMWKTYLVSFISALIMAAVVNLVINLVIVFELAAAMKIGFVLWLGFVATTGISEYLYTDKPKPFALYFINTGYQLVNLLIAAALTFYLS
jgi:hypothetical protein